MGAEITNKTLVQDEKTMRRIESIALVFVAMVAIPVFTSGKEKVPAPLPCLIDGIGYCLSGPPAVSCNAGCTSSGIAPYLTWQCTVPGNARSYNPFSIANPSNEGYWGTLAPFPNVPCYTEYICGGCGPTASQTCRPQGQGNPSTTVTQSVGVDYETWGCL